MFQTNLRFLFMAFTALVSFTSTHAQAPQVINYQAIVRDAAGNIVQNKAVNFRLSILDSGPSGTPQYIETQSKTTNQFGLVTFGIGQGTTVSGSMNAVTWATGNKFFKVELDINGGNSFTVMNTSQFLSVPYALYAANGGSGATGWGLTGNTAVANNYLGTNNGQDLRFYTNNTQKAVITIDGNMSIGTSTPTSRLSLESNSDGSGVIDGRFLLDLKNTSTSSASQAVMKFTAGNSGNYMNISQSASSYTIGPDADAGIVWANGTGGLILRASPKSGSDPDVGAIRFLTGWNSATVNVTNERMRVQANGNVGIGISAPNTKLHLVGDDNGSGSGQTDGRFFLRINNQSTGNGSQSGIQFMAGGTNNETTIGHVSPSYSVVSGFGDFAQFRTSGAGIVLQAANANGIIRFQSGGVTDKMVINATGNVGVGTTIPKAKIEVANGDVYLNDSTKGIILTSPNGNCWRVTVDNTGNLVRTQIICPQ